MVHSTTTIKIWLKPLVLAFFILGALCSTAQNHVTESTATFFPQWKKGDKHVYEITLTKHKAIGDSLLTGISSTSTVAIEVLESKDSVFTLEWIYRSVDMEDSITQDNKMIKRILRLSKGMRLEYTVDKNGMFLELQNWEEVRDHMDKALDRLMREFEYLKPEDELIANLRAGYSTAENTEQSLRKEIDLYHAPYGLTYDKDQPQEFQETLSNPLGGEDFPATIRYELVEVNSESAEIRISQQVDEAATFEIIKQYLQALASEYGNELPEDQLPQINISDENNYSVDLTEGWIKRATMTRTSETAEVTQVETYIINQLK